MSLRAQIMLLIGAVLSLAIVSYALLATRLIKADKLASIYDINGFTAQSLGEQIDFRCDRLRRDLAGVAGTGDLDSWARQVMLVDPAILHLEVTADNDPRSTGSWEAEPTTSPIDEARLTQLVAGAAPPDVDLANPLEVTRLGELQDALLRVSILEPRSSRVVSAVVDTNHLLRSLGGSRQLGVALIRDSGEVLVANDVGARLPTDVFDAVLASKASRAVISVSVPRSNAAFIAGYTRLEAAPMRVVIASPEGVAQQALNRMAWHATLVGLAILFLTLIVLVFVSRRLTRPIAHLVDAAERLGAGEHDVDSGIELAPSGELRVLGEAFCRMARELSLRHDALEASEERLRALVENLPNGVALVNREGEVVFENAHLRRLLELDEDVTGLHLSSVAGPALIDHVLSVAHGGAHIPFGRTELYAAAGVALPVEYTVLGIQLRGESLALASIHDLTEEETLRLRATRAERLATIGTLAAGICHEINNPLQYVVASHCFIEDELNDVPADVAQRIREELDAAREGTDRVAAIVSDLRIFSRDPEPNATVADVNSVIRSSLNMAEARIRGVATTQLDLADTPPVTGDTVLLGQVFMNLIINAIDAMEDQPGENTLRLSTATSNDVVKVSVSDTGCGMSESVLRRVFEPFFTTKALGVGTGMGLWMVQGIVEKLGGKLTVDTHRGLGTTFDVHLPVAREIRVTTESRSDRVGATA